eukprot:s3138_g1.t1
MLYYPAKKLTSFFVGRPGGVSNIFRNTSRVGDKPSAPTQSCRPKVDQCSRSCLPYLAWSVPFLIRARQCVITARHAPDALSRDLQRINLAKYCSALPVVFFAMCHARVIPGISDVSMFTSEDFEVLWALAAIVNSAFSFIWDLVMDWGLLHLMPHKPGNFGLRPVLLYPQPPIVYYLAIVLNFIGRTLWSLRWSEQATIFLGAFFLSSVQQAAEVLRRCLWNVLRVEWQCICKGKCSDRYRPELLDKITMQEPPLAGPGSMGQVLQVEEVGALLSERLFLLVQPKVSEEQFPQMPQYQLDLIFEDSAIQMQAQANKDINTEMLGVDD